MKTVELLETCKFQILEHFLILNEYKKENKYIPVEDYEQLLETYLTLVESYIDSEESDQKFKISLGEILGVKFYNT
jgi:hypothetical protein